MILAGGSSTLPYSQLRGPPIGARSLLESLGCVGHVFHPFHPNQVSLGSKKNTLRGGTLPRKQILLKHFMTHSHQMKDFLIVATFSQGLCFPSLETNGDRSDSGQMLCCAGLVLPLIGSALPSFALGRWANDHWGKGTLRGPRKTG